LSQTGLPSVTISWRRRRVSPSPRWTTPTARDATLRHLFDAIACAVAGSATEPAEIAVRVARSVRGDESATVWGACVNSAFP
jgi:2-methylcitrate dehydratase PrpD